MLNSVEKEELITPLRRKPRQFGCTDAIWHRVLIASRLTVHNDGDTTVHAWITSAILDKLEKEGK